MKRVLAFLLPTLVGISVANADILKCRGPDGSITYTDSGCDGQTVEQRYRYARPENQQQVRSEIGGLDANSAAQALGFQSYSHFEKSRRMCLELLEQNPLISDGMNCGTDIECLKSEADLMQRRFHTLANSTIWKQNKCDTVLQVEYGGKSTGNSDSYEIEVAHDDELFIINGETFEARTYCFNMNAGDHVIFIEGSPLGACASASVINLRTKDKCDLWCE